MDQGRGQEAIGRRLAFRAMSRVQWDREAQVAARVAVTSVKEGKDGEEVGMIFLYDGSNSCVEIEKQMEVPVERLFSPGTRFSADNDREKGFGIDNFAFSGCNRGSLESLLVRLEPRRHQCHFVSLPDIVGNARRTLEIFHMVKYRYPVWPRAFVCQDGIEDLEIPWGDIKAIFIGGTDRFKLSSAALDCIRAAKILSKWVHVGRINSFERWDKFESAGADSCDGSGFSRYGEAMFPTFRNKRIHLFSELQSSNGG